MIPSSVLDCFLLQLTIDFGSKKDQQWGEIMGYSIPTDFMTEFFEGKKNGPAICMALSRASFYLAGDILLFPYVRNFHWSIIGVYIKERVVVHCDSMATRDSKEDKAIFSAILQSIENFYAHERISINVKNFRLIPLHHAGLQQQEDVASSAFFTAVFAYSLLSFKDLTIEAESLPSIRYWVTQLALTARGHSSIRKTRRGSHCDVVLDSNIKLPAFTKPHLNEDEGPFAALQRFLERD